jgi:hypothetical protein
MTIQPNPARDNVVITINGLKTAATISIKGTDSRTVYTSTVEPAGKEVVTRRLDVSGYPAGMYFLQLVSEGHYNTTRFIIR